MVGHAFSGGLSLLGDGGVRQIAVSEEGIGERVGVARREEGAGAAGLDQFGYATDVCADDGFAQGIALQHRHGRVLVPLRRQYNSACGTDEVPQGIAALVAQEFNVRRVAGQPVQVLLDGAGASDAELDARVHGRGDERPQALLGRQPAEVYKRLSRGKVGLVALRVDVVGDVDEFLPRPSPFGELLAVEPAGDDNTVQVPLVDPQEVMNGGLDGNEAADSRRVVNAPMECHVEDVAALAALADSTAVEHLVCGTGDLEIVGGKHRRDPSFLQQGQHRWGQMVVDAMNVRHVGGEPIQQRAKFALGLERVNHLGSHFRLGQR